MLRILSVRGFDERHDRMLTKQSKQAVKAYLRGCYSQYDLYMALSQVVTDKQKFVEAMQKLHFPK